MNNNITEGNIDQIMGKVKEGWGELTDDEVMKTEAKAEKLIGLIKEKYGESQEKIKVKLKELGIIA